MCDCYWPGVWLVHPEVWDAHPGQGEGGVVWLQLQRVVAGAQLQEPRAVPGEGEEGHRDHVPQRGHRANPVAAHSEAAYV